MGSTHHHHYHQDEKKVKELEKKLEETNERSRQQANQARANAAQYQSQMNNLQKNLNDIKDPSKVALRQRQIFQNFLCSLKAKSKNVDSRNLFLVGIIGPTNAGKSSIINKIVKPSKLCETGQGQVTMVNSSIQTEKTVVVDTIGLNQDRDVTDPLYLADFYKLDRVILLYETTPKQCRFALQTLSKILPDEVYLVRTKCDRVKKQQRSSILTREQEVVKSWGIKYNKKIYFYSIEELECQAELRKLILQRN